MPKSPHPEVANPINPLMADIQAAVTILLKEEVDTQAQDKRALRSSATREFKMDTRRSVLEKVQNPKSGETIDFLLEWQKKVDSKKQREMLEDQENKMKAMEMRLSGADVSTQELYSYF